MDIVTSFVNMEFRKRGKNTDENEEVKGKDGLKNVLALLYGQTMGLTQPKALAPAIENLERRKGWLPTTTDIYLTHFKNFCEYCNCYERPNVRKDFKIEVMKKACRDVKRKISVDVSKSKREGAKERFAQVPTKQQVTKRQRQVIEALTNDLDDKKLSLNFLKALNFFLLQVRLNVRPGPLLNIKWDQFDSHLRHGFSIETNEHKTGNFL